MRLIINDITQNSNIFPVHDMDLMISSFSFETIMFAVVYFRQSLTLSHSVSPLQFHLAVGSGAQQHGDAFLRSHRRQLRPRVPLSVRRLADHRLLLQRGGGGDALLPLVPGHDGPRHGHGARPGHGSGLTVWQVPSSSRLVEMVLVFVFWFEGRRCFLLTPGRRVGSCFCQKIIFYFCTIKCQTVKIVQHSFWALNSDVHFTVTQNKKQQILKSEKLIHWTADLSTYWFLLL